MTCISGMGAVEVLKDEVKDTPRPPRFLGKMLGGVAWAAQGLGDGGAARSELQRELSVREKKKISVTIKMCVPASFKGLETTARASSAGLTVLWPQPRCLAEQGCT